MAYTDEYPFEAYITNLGKYNEGALVGEWVKFPTTAEEIQDVFKRIGIDGVRYEGWFITDYDCHVEGIYDVLGEYESLDELNYLATKITELNKNEYERFEAAIQISDYSKSVKDLINLTDNLDKYDIYPDVHDHDDLGRMYIEEYGSMEIPEHLKNYIDYEAYGWDIAMDEIGEFTDFGYVRDTGDSFYEEYDGDRENIPEEYRVMSSTDDTELDNDERSEQEETMTVLVVEPLKEPYIKEISTGLSAMQAEVGGMIAATYPFYDQVAVICNDEGKLNGMDLNRALRDDSGEIYDIVAGTFLVTGLGEESFSSLSPELAEKYLEHFKTPELFAMVDGELTVLPIPVEELRTYEIYQLKDFADRQDFAFEPLDRIHEQGHKVDMQNYEKVYFGAMFPNENLESIFTRFNIDRPKDFTGHSLSVSDVVVIHQNGQDTAHYCDRFGFTETPEFFQVQTRAATHSNYQDMVALIGADGNVYLGKSENYHFSSSASMPWHSPGQEYGDTASHYDNSDKSLIFISDNPKMFSFISGEGWVKSQADMLKEELFTQEDYSEFARIQAEVVSHLPYKDNFTGIQFDGQPFEPLPENYLKNTEMAMEDDYGMIDGIINNGPKETTPPSADEKPSIRERLSEAKQECEGRNPPAVKKPEKPGPEHDL